MKKRIILIIGFSLALVLFVFGQGKLMHDGSGDPSGNCNNAIYVNTATGEHWSCSANVWAKDSSKVMMSGNSPIIFRAKGLNVNQVTTDIGSFTGLPSRYIPRRFSVDNCSATPTLATIDLRTATGGAGSAVVVASPLSSLTASTTIFDATLAITTTVQTASTLTIRSVAAAGSTATCDFTLVVDPLP